MQSTGTRPCPDCGAAERPGAPWCTACFAVLTSAAPGAGSPPAVRVPPPAPLLPFPLPVPLPVPPPVPPPAAREDAAAGWPCSSCSARNDLDRDTCGTCGAGFLASAVERPSLPLPGGHDLLQLGAGRRVLLAVGAAGGLAALMVLVSVVLGAVLQALAGPAGA